MQSSAVQLCVRMCASEKRLGEKVILPAVPDLRDTHTVPNARLDFLPQ